MNSTIKSTVKIMAVADIHGNYDLISIPEKVGLVVLAGDIVAQKEPTKEDVCNCANTIESICKSHPDAQFLFVQGNHDYAIKDKWGLDEELVTRRVSNLHCFSKNAKVVDVCGIRVGGFGWDAGHKKDRYLTRYEENASVFDGVDVLLMHCPPKIDGVHLHEDNLGLAKVVKMVRPKLVVCGHAHHQFGEYGLDGIPVYCVAQKSFILHVQQGMHFHHERLCDCAKLKDFER